MFHAARRGLRPEGACFTQPRATPWGPGTHIPSSVRPNGPTVRRRNGWAVGPRNIMGASCPQGVALGWENEGPSARFRNKKRPSSECRVFNTPSKTWIRYLSTTAILLLAMLCPAMRALRRRRPRKWPKSGSGSRHTSRRRRRRRRRRPPWSCWPITGRCSPTRGLTNPCGSGTASSNAASIATRRASSWFACRRRARRSPPPWASTATTRLGPDAARSSSRSPWPTRRLFGRTSFARACPARRSRSTWAAPTEFTLAVSDSGDGFSCDQADWADAQVTLADGKTVWLGDLPLVERPQAGCQRRAVLVHLRRAPVGSAAAGLETRVRHSEARRPADRARRDVHRPQDGPGRPMRGRRVPRLPDRRVDAPLQEHGQGQHADPREHPGVGPPLAPRTGRRVRAAPHARRLVHARQLRAAGHHARARRDAAFRAGRRSPDQRPVALLQRPMGRPGVDRRDRLARPMGRRVPPRRGRRPADSRRAGADAFQPAARAKRSARRWWSLQFYRGDRIRAQNVWRAWMLAHNLPRPGGKPPEPMFSSCSGGFFPGLKCNEANELRFIDTFVKRGHQARLLVDGRRLVSVRRLAEGGHLGSRSRAFSTRHPRRQRSRPRQGGEADPLVRAGAGRRRHVAAQGASRVGPRRSGRRAA